jgi:hypothetical protein
LLTVTDEQKVRFAAQQLLGSASAWWDTFNAMQQVDHRVTWQEFTTAFREYFIPVGVLNRKLLEFLDLKQGSLSVMEYANKFNHLAQYVGTHVDTDEKTRASDRASSTAWSSVVRGTTTSSTNGRS